MWFLFVWTVWDEQYMRTCYVLGIYVSNIKGERRIQDRILDLYKAKEFVISYVPIFC